MSSVHINTFFNFILKILIQKTIEKKQNKYWSLFKKWVHNEEQYGNDIIRIKWEWNVHKISVCTACHYDRHPYAHSNRIQF